MDVENIYTILLDMNAPTEGKLLALRSVRDTSMLLILLQIVICGYLFTSVFTDRIFYGSMGQYINFPALLVQFAWLIFIASIAVSALLLYEVPSLMERAASGHALDELTEEKIMLLSVLPLQLVRAGQFLLFDAGLAVLALAILIAPASGEY